MAGAPRLQSLPKDLKIHLLLCMPANDVGRLMLYAPDFAAIVREANLEKAYENEDAFVVLSGYRSRGWNFLLSRFRDTKSVTPLPLSVTDRYLDLLPLSHCNGVICSRSDKDCVLMNPSIGYCKVLPRLLSQDLEEVNTFLGFSPSISKFKVVALSRSHPKLPFGNPRVLTVEDKECLWEWRALECDIADHKPESASDMSSVCINENLYYAAQLLLPTVPGSSSITMAMICFNLKTEAFVSCQIPETSVSKYTRSETCPFNIRGKVGISFADNKQGQHRIWVLEDVHQNNWSLLLLNIHPNILDMDKWLPHGPPPFRGLTKNGGMVYAKAGVKDLVIGYFDDEQSQESIVEGVLRDRSMVLFWDYVSGVCFF
ncbi:unnamed protein product [Eruca vesicaria subsp. sativa]|uniref:F-box associated beta-propeller type 3 domain-containing protein n=1 Tax=Eruca vesicaria subsp. sativa TaxID=29727 RepID=A0ABC8JHD8_ERUVS|nr:unnamed protein product [Eruca vesicaria subsp. sativa]